MARTVTDEAICPAGLLLRAKTYQPTTGRPLVSRLRLIELVDAGLRRKLTLPVGLAVCLLLGLKVRAPEAGG